MAMPRRNALNAIRRLKTIQQRRFASHDSHHHGHTVKESLGGQFYFFIAVPPVLYGLYAATRPGKDGEQPWFTRWLSTFDEWREETARRNDLHAKLADQAAGDRILFTHSEVAPVHRRVHVRNLEMINARDPHNQQAGWGSINLEKLQAHVEQENAEQDRQTLEKLKQRLIEEEESKK